MSTTPPPSGVLPFRLPNQRPGCLSPLVFHALTHRPSALDIESRLFGLVCEEGVQVGKDGIQLGGQLFWNEELTPFVKVSKVTKRSPFVVWYDEAALAAGRLTEITFGCIEPNGARVPRFKCKNKNMGGVIATIDPAAVLERRAKYQRALAARVSKAEQAYIERSAGAREVERLLELQQQRRDQHNRGAGEDPIQPVVDERTVRQQKAADQAAKVAAVRDGEKRPDVATSPSEKEANRRRGRNQSTTGRKKQRQSRAAVAAKRASRETKRPASEESRSVSKKSPRADAPRSRTKQSVNPRGAKRTVAGSEKIGMKVRQAWRSAKEKPAPKSVRNKADLYDRIASYHSTSRTKTDQPSSSRSK